MLQQTLLSDDHKHTLGIGTIKKNGFLKVVWDFVDKEHNFVENTLYALLL